jgi:hypothetical protein
MREWTWPVRHATATAAGQVQALLATMTREQQGMGMSHRRMPAGALLAAALSCVVLRRRPRRPGRSGAVPRQDRHERVKISPDDACYA